MLTAIAGHDPDDPTSIVAPIPDYRVALGRDVRGLRLGLPTNPFYRFGHAEPLTILERGRQALLDLGLVPVPVVLPRAEETNGLSRTIIDVDVWLYHEQFRDREALYGRDFRDRARTGRETPAIAYARAQEAQADIRRCWLGLFERMDLLLLPGNVAVAPRHGVRTIVVDGEAYPVPMVTSRFNRAANVTGLPALTLPVGGTADGLPVALQLVGPPLGEARLLAVAHALEQALGNLPARWGIEPRQLDGARDREGRGPSETLRMGPGLELGIAIPQTFPDARPRATSLVDYLRRAEARGFQNVWVQEQLLGPMPSLEPA